MLYWYPPSLSIYLKFAHINSPFHQAQFLFLLLSLHMISKCTLVSAHSLPFFPSCGVHPPATNLWTCHIPVTWCLVKCASDFYLPCIDDDDDDDDDDTSEDDEVIKATPAKKTSGTSSCPLLSFTLSFYHFVFETAVSVFHFCWLFQWFMSACLS